jgi:hypothetical protein
MSFACVRCGIATTEVLSLALDDGVYAPAMCPPCKEAALDDLAWAEKQRQQLIDEGVHPRIATRLLANAFDQAVHADHEVESELKLQPDGRGES